MNTNDNKVAGKAFEARFKQMAQSQGLLAIKQELNAKYIGGGGVKAFKGDLDYKLIDRRGHVGFFDTKSFEGNSFKHSHIDKAQLEKALMYNDWGVPAGFVVYHRGSNEVAFYSGHSVHMVGPGHSIGSEDGVHLGRIEEFNLRAIMPLYMVTMHEPTLRPG